MKKVLEIAYHRNGVFGTSFHVVRFIDRLKGDSEDDTFIGVVFPEDYSVAVFNERLLGQGVIKFGQNSYRGDHFEWWLRNEIAQWEKKLYNNNLPDHDPRDYVD